MVTSGGADELTALLGQNTCNSSRVLAAQRLAGEDHSAGVDLVRMQVRLLIGFVDDLAERGLVDQLLALIRGERIGRLVECFTRNHVIAAGEVLAIAAQIDAREDDLGAGRADIDADAHQRDVILQPDRILLERPVVIELEMVVIVVGIIVVLVDDVLAIEMVVKAVSPLWFLVVGISHQQPLLNTSMPSRRPGSSRATLDLPKNPIGIAWRVRADGGRIGLRAGGLLPGGLTDPLILSTGSC